MPEIIPDHVPSPRTLLAWDGTAYRPIHIDALGNVQIDVVASALPVGAATAAAQALILAQVQLIEDMRDALQTVDTDRLIVRGEDQVFSFKERLADFKVGAVSGADGFYASNGPADGLVWVVTNVNAVDTTSPTTRIRLRIVRGALAWFFGDETAAFPINTPMVWGGHVYLEHDDVIFADFIGSLAGDTCMVTLTGYVMTKE